jgi:hypothetical protein
VLRRAFQRPLAWFWANVLGVLIMAYFILRFTVLLCLWVVLGPVAFLFMLFGSEAVFGLLDGLLEGMDGIAQRIYDALDFVGDPN